MTKDLGLNMMFFIKRKKLLKNGEAPVFIRITANGSRTEFSMCRSIPPFLWCAEKGAARGNNKEVKVLNKFIDTVRFQLYDHYRILKDDDKEISASALKDAFLGIVEEDKTLLRIFEDHNDKVRALTGKDFSPETCQRYETSLMHTKRFIQKYYGKDDLRLSEVDHQFILNYEFYFKSDRSCSHNTTMKYLKNFKKIIRIALANNWMKQDPFANYKMRLEKVDRGFLSTEELDTLINKRFGIERLDQIKDCFVFSCFTGLAHSDLKRLTTDHIFTDEKGQQWVKIKRLKTNNQSNVPILPAAKSIILKYEGHPYCTERNVLLPVVSNQKMNAYLKEIADLCGIKKNLTSHIARHTFATTVTLNNDVPIESVSKMLGHSSITMTRIYARLLDKKVSNDMEKLHDIYR